MSADEERRFLIQIESRINNCKGIVKDLQNHVDRLQGIFSIPSVKLNPNPENPSMKEEPKAQIPRIEKDVGILIDQLNMVKESLEGVIYTLGVE